jgi:hypothetical protein
MGNATYFVRTRGRVTGPFDRETLQKLARRGAVSRVNDVSADRVNWSSAGEYEDLFPTHAAGMPLAIAPRPATEPAHAVSGPAAATQVKLDPLSDPLPDIAPVAPPPPDPARPSRLIANLTSQAPLPASPPPAPTGPQPNYKRWALVSLITAICGVPLFGLVTGVVAMVFAIIALTGMQRTGNNSGKGMALAGFILGIVDFLGWMFYLIVMTTVFRPH